MVALLNSAVQYVDSTQWAAVAAYPGALTLTSAGVLCTNTANSPALGNERVYVAITGGTTGASEPTFTTTKGASNTDGSVVWMECTGQPGVNGDTLNSPVWGATLGTTQGQIIYDSVSASLQMVLVAGTTGSSLPAFSATAGTATADNTVTWHSLGLASSFGAFAAAHKRILNADAGSWQTVVPAKIYIGDDHAPSQGSALTLAGGQGTAAAPNQYLTVSHLVAPPTSVTTGSSEAVTGAFNLNVQGYGYYYGINFLAGNAANNANMEWGGNAAGNLVLENCTSTLNNTFAGATLGLGASNAQAFTITLINPTFIFGNTSQNIQQYDGNIIVINASVAQSGSIPSVLIKHNAVAGGTLLIRDSDLSKITGTLLNPNSEAGNLFTILENCKLGSGVAMTTGAFLDGASTLKVHNCDSGSKNYRFYESGYLASVQQETTIVDTTNPASNGAQTISWNISTSSSVAFGQPYVSPEIAQWCNLVTGSHTATIQIDSNVALTNAQVWMELEYLGSSATPVGSVITSRVAPLASATVYPTSSDIWGGSQTSQQYMQVSFSPALAGYIKVRIYVAIPSATIYVNPLILVV